MDILAEQITGVILILISFWEFYSVRGVFLNSKRHGTKSTSHLLPAALWSGIVFGVAMLGFGMALIFKQI
ncbi:immunity protein [Weissella paramesenteroides]|uniref:immunity protein n=1 Tax=Weissella paramesenteroides TaxID=1249 RepID=UPI0030B9CD71